MNNVVHIAPAPDDWEKCLRYNGAGQLTKDVHNVALILKNAPGFAGCLSFDTMANRVIWQKRPAYELGLEAPEPGVRLKDHHAVYVQGVMAKYRQLSVGKDIAWCAIEAAAQANAFHPVQDYLDHLALWDGKYRVPKWLHQYVGADDTEYNAAVGRWWLISAVARAYQPGCQVDHMLILEGGQGAGKSQAVRALGSPWTLGSLPDLRDTARAADVIGPKWIVEIAELDAFKGINATRIKDFVSQQVDSYRPAYGRATIDRPRSCLFIGTTNEKAYLSDPTGARRFWPVRVEHEIKLEALRAERDQIWAEAKLLYQSGEQWHPEKSLIPTIMKEQKDRQTHHMWENMIRAFVHNVEETTTDDILIDCIRKEPKQWGREDEMGVSKCMNDIGDFTSKRRDKKGGGKERVWLRIRPPGD